MAILVVSRDAELIGRQPFPGPGLAVRIVGEVTAERLELLRRADAVVVDEVRRHGWYGRLWQSFAVLLPGRTVRVILRWPSRTEGFSSRSTTDNR